MQTIRYENTDVNINQWLHEIELKEIEENTRFIIDFSEMDIDDDITFNGISPLKCNNNRLRKINCPNITELHCPHNNLDIIDCPNLKKLDCSYNGQINLNCPNLISLTCFDVISESISICTISGYYTELQQLTLPESVDAEDFECLICDEKRNKEIKCEQCNNSYCVPCFIEIFKASKFAKCPYCRLEFKNNIRLIHMERYIEQIRERLE